jgi:hypothetical protein
LFTSWWRWQHKKVIFSVLEVDMFLNPECIRSLSRF